MEKDLDIKLYNEYLDGNKEAFELLYNKYKEKIQYFIYNIVKDYQKAEDITQDTFVYVMQNKIKEGYRVFTVGEMGIANTTASACILGAFNRWNAVEVTGRGTNISDARLLHKIEMVQKALDVNQPDPADGLDVLSKVGGFEFGCMTGVMLGAAANHCLTIIDGFNSTASAFIAKALSEESVQYLMASHLSLEQAHRKSLKAIGLTEYIDLDIRLGEAVGASIQKKILDMAIAVYKDGADKRTGVAE